MILARVISTKYLDKRGAAHNFCSQIFDANDTLTIKVLAGINKLYHPAISLDVLLFYLTVFYVRFVYIIFK